jgi:trans-feruloyl-CoA hydratase/vanillin synthase
MADYNYECVKVEIKDGVGWAILNRPEKRNAMSPQLHYDMDDALASMEVDENVKVVIVTGAGGNFSAGQDLRKFFRELEQNPRERKRAAEAANRWRWARLYNYDKPTIAMVHGYCVGGAFMQLLGCDFAVAAEDATFSLSEVNWGILPGALVSKVVADMVLPRHALYYACLGKPFDGKEAARIGMVNFAVPPEKLEETTLELAGELMKKSPNVLRATKQAIKHVRTMDFDQSYDYLMAKGRAIQVGDREDSYNTGLKQFLDDKSYKPTYEPFKKKEGASRK